MNGVPQSNVTGLKPGLNLPILSNQSDVVKGCKAEQEDIDNRGDDCHTIAAACEASFFVLGKSKEGYGLWRNCINPIVQGLTEEDVNNLKPGMTIPKVPASMITACKATYSMFGKGIVGLLLE